MAGLQQVAMAIAGSAFVFVTYSMDATRGLRIAGTVIGALQLLPGCPGPSPGGPAAQDRHAFNPPTI